jgi:hypothetical protein
MTFLDTKLKAFAKSNLKTTQIEVKVQGAFDAMDYSFTIAFSCNSELVWGKMCYKSVIELKA